MYELKIKPLDWLLILVTGVLFSSLLAMLGYALVQKSFYEGVSFGGMLGFCITFYSLVLITFMNSAILPNISKKYWNFIAALFSFLSGFFGFLSGVFIAELFGIEILGVILEELYMISLIVGILTYAMGIIIYSFVNIRNQKERRDYEYVQSRLKSLETQLNPHFIFNALNSIAELIHQDQNKAEDAVLKMSGFLRNTMSEKALIPLVDEVKNVRAYLELENIRFSNQLYLHIESKIPQWQVPKFSLQLLVENGIKHGFEAKALNVYVRFDEEHKQIIVSNDGKPIGNKTFGIGLGNLKQRLELLCKGEIYISDPTRSEFTIILGKCDENTDS